MAIKGRRLTMPGRRSKAFRKSAKSRIMNVELHTEAFNKDLQRVLKKAEVKKEPTLRNVMFFLLGEVIKLTPIKTGFARGSWMPYLREVGGAVPGAGKVTANYSRAAEKEGEDEGSWDESKSGRAFTIKVASHVPYILRLEFGWSKQAPRGMLRPGMKITRRKLRQEFAELFR